MSFTEEEFLPLSAIQHFVFCERQYALIHIEQIWRENQLTLEGSHMHSRVDDREKRRELRGDVLVVRGLPIRSFELGLSGRADVIEFHRYRFRPSSEMKVQGLKMAVTLPGLNGEWTPFPIDYKRGKPKIDSCDEVQLCAQAICLEEMLNVIVPEGAIFYGKIQRRHQVSFDDSLRKMTGQAALRLRELFISGVTPHAQKTPKCRRCSLLDICVPQIMSTRFSCRRHFDGLMKKLLEKADYQ